MASCPECRTVGGWLLDLHKSGALPLHFGVVDVDLARSRTEAPSLWQSLEDLSQARRLDLVHEERELASWGLAELLCRMSRETAPQEAARAHELAELAVSVAEAVEDDRLAEARWAYQLRGLAWACLSNARRVAGDLPDAERAFGVADSWWTAGWNATGDVLGYEASFLDLKASLWIAQSVLRATFSLGCRGR